MSNLLAKLLIPVIGFADANTPQVKAAGAGQVLFFVLTDCPISNFYAPEIQRICGVYGGKGIGCSLVYEDEGVTDAAIRKHGEDFGYKSAAVSIDRDRRIAARVKAAVTPEAVVLDSGGKVRYRGRIDNFYADLGKPRRQATTHELTDALDAMLAGRAVAVPETKAVGCSITLPEVRQ